MTPRVPTEKSPFNLAYETEVMIPLEIELLSIKVEQCSEPNNFECSNEMQYSKQYLYTLGMKFSFRIIKLSQHLSSNEMSVLIEEVGVSILQLGI